MIDKSTQDRIKLPRYYLYGLSSSNEPNNIRYIGYSVEPEKRLKEHIRDCKRTKVNTHKKNWISKEMKNGYVILFSILGEESSMEVVKEKEIKLIKEYKDNGVQLVNGTDGGDGVVATQEVKNKISNKRKGFKHTEETKNLISTLVKGRKHSEETRIKMSQKHKGKKLSDETIEKLKNRTHSDESKKKMSNNKIGKSFKDLFGDEKADKVKEKISKSKKGVPAKNKKPILQFDSTDLLVKEYESLSEAMEITHISNISKCLTGERKIAGEYKWKYKI